MSRAPLFFGRVSENIDEALDSAFLTRVADWMELCWGSYSCSLVMRDIYLVTIIGFNK
jgi:hypothetical protein